MGLATGEPVSGVRFILPLTPSKVKYLTSIAINFNMHCGRNYDRKPNIHFDEKNGLIRFYRFLYFYEPV
jgi:hypothetical protein